MLSSVYSRTLFIFAFTNAPTQGNVSFGFPGILCTFYGNWAFEEHAEHFHRCSSKKLEEDRDKLIHHFIWQILFRIVFDVRFNFFLLNVCLRTLSHHLRDNCLHRYSDWVCVYVHEIGANKFICIYGFYVLRFLWSLSRSRRLLGFPGTVYFDYKTILDEWMTSSSIWEF